MQMRSRLRALWLALSLVLGIAAAAAHSVEKGPAGGRVRHAGKLHIELLIADGALKVYVYDEHDKPVIAKGIKASVVLQIGGKPVRVTLEPREENLLVGAFPAGAHSSTKAVVQVTAPDGTSAQARFD